VIFLGTILATVIYLTVTRVDRTEAQPRTASGTTTLAGPGS
jgi:hypothetical protein